MNYTFLVFVPISFLNATWQAGAGKGNKGEIHTYPKVVGTLLAKIALHFENRICKLKPYSDILLYTCMGHMCIQSVVSITLYVFHSTYMFM